MKGFIRKVYSDSIDVLVHPIIDMIDMVRLKGETGWALLRNKLGFGPHGKL